jgi:hypothetical protein
MTTKFTSSNDKCRLIPQMTTKIYILKRLIQVESSDDKKIKILKITMQVDSSEDKKQFHPQTNNAS